METKPPKNKDTPQERPLDHPKTYKEERHFIIRLEISSNARKMFTDLFGIVKAVLIFMLVH